MEIAARQADLGASRPRSAHPLRGTAAPLAGRYSLADSAAAGVGAGGRGVTAPEVLVAEAREALLRGPVFRVDRAEAAPGGIKAVAADGVEFPKGRGLYAISELTRSCGHR